MVSGVEGVEARSDRGVEGRIDDCRRAKTSDHGDGGRVDAPVPVDADDSRDRHRHYDGGDGGVAADGAARGHGQFFDELGPDNVFIYKTSGDPNQLGESPKERKRRPIKKEYADMITLRGHGAGCSARALYSAGAERIVMTAKVPGFETDSFRWWGRRRIRSSWRRAISIRAGIFTDEEKRAGPTWRCSATIWRRALYPGRQRGGQDLHAGWRGIHA